jgi:uncharacterized protein (DUF2267 family)
MPENSAPHEPAQIDAATARFYDAIERSGALPAGITAAEAARAVACVLWLRITLGEVRRVLAALPPTLRGEVEPCAERSTEQPAVFNRQQFLSMISSRLRGLDATQADAVAQVVLGALYRQLPRREQRAVASQLPQDLREFWGPQRPIAA